MHRARNGGIVDGMALKRDDTGGELIKGSPVVKGYTPRRFPWRLWLYAIIMTGAAGAGGYFVWQYREAAKSALTDLDVCKAGTDSRVAGAKTDAEAACAKKVADADKKTKDAEHERDDAKAQLASVSTNLSGAKEALAEAEKRKAAIDEIQKQFAKMIDTGQLKISARRGALVVSLPAEVLFPSGSAELSKPGEYAVVEVAGVLKKFKGRRFLVVGHTDNVALTKPKDPTACNLIRDNWQLSTERALTVTHVLVTAGMDAENVIPAGMGEHDPIANNATAEGRQRNRRIEIALLPAINELPPLPASLTKDDGGAAQPAPAPKK
jgi:chemotaxis protein MotB